MKPADKIIEKINNYSDWRSDILKELRELINETSPDLVEDFKWNTAVWTNNGLVCAISGFKDHVKINFFKGAYLPDPKNMFNSGLDNKEHRSINLGKSNKLDKAALKSLVQAAISYNQK